jgi:hypothetical protein
MHTACCGGAPGGWPSGNLVEPELPATVSELVDRGGHAADRVGSDVMWEEIAVRNPAVDALDVLVGDWELTLTDAWFLDSRDVRQNGHATARWLGEAFVELDAELEGEPTWHFVFGRSDPDNQLIGLYHDPGRPRGCSAPPLPTANG